MPANKNWSNKRWEDKAWSQKHSKTIRSHLMDSLRDPTQRYCNKSVSVTWCLRAWLITKLKPWTYQTKVYPVVWCYLLVLRRQPNFGALLEPETVVRQWPLEGAGVLAAGPTPKMLASWLKHLNQTTGHLQDPSQTSSLAAPGSQWELDSNSWHPQIRSPPSSSSCRSRRLALKQHSELINLHELTMNECCWN